MSSLPKTRVFFDTMSEVLQGVRTAASQTYARLEIGSAQAKLLRQIGNGSRVSQAELARLTQTAPTIVGRAIEPLIARGWVKRSNSKEDKRQYVLELTAEGKKALEWVEEARDEIIARLGKVLDDRDLADFERIGKKLLGAFQ